MAARGAGACRHQPSTFRLSGDALRANEFVRMEVVPYGFDARIIERDLRELLDVAGDRFEGDILQLRDDEPVGGLAFDLAQADDRARTLQAIKERLIDIDGGFGGHFRNYLQRKLEKPEFADHIRCWFPTDDLRIEYSRTGNGRDWRPSRRARRVNVRRRYLRSCSHSAMSRWCSTSPRTIWTTT